MIAWYLCLQECNPPVWGWWSRWAKLPAASSGMQGLGRIRIQGTKSLNTQFNPLTTRPHSLWGSLIETALPFLHSCRSPIDLDHIALNTGWFGQEKQCSLFHGKSDNNAKTCHRPGKIAQETRKQTTTKNKPRLRVSHRKVLHSPRQQSKRVTVLKVKLFLPDTDVDHGNGNLINQQLKATLFPYPPPLARLENDMFFFTMFSPSSLFSGSNAECSWHNSSLTPDSHFFEYYPSNKTPDLDSFKWPLAWVTPIS